MSKMKDLDIDRKNWNLLLKETTKKRYIKMLEIVPPRIMMKDGFLVGEPVDHKGASNEARYEMFTDVKGQCLERGPKTVAEFKQIMKIIKIIKIFE